jgi:anti-sigma regulatory factor (Ser/Thr protein kinase)
MHAQTIMVPDTLCLSGYTFHMAQRAVGDVPLLQGPRRMITREGSTPAMAATTTRRGNNRGGNAERSAAQAPGSRGEPASRGGPPPLAAPDSLTIAAVPGNVRKARAFVAEVLGPDHPCADAAVLLCSELVTNAVLHSNSRRPGGTVTVIVADRTGPGWTGPDRTGADRTGPDRTASVQVAVIDEGSASSIPVVKAESYAPDGHGLFLVENLAQQWGYESDDEGTTVWFRLVP